MDLTKLTVEQLKALAYDLLVQVQQAQNNLQVVNNEIGKRVADSQQQTKEEKKK